MCELVLFPVLKDPKDLSEKNNIRLATTGRQFFPIREEVKIDFTRASDPETDPESAVFYALRNAFGKTIAQNSVFHNAKVLKKPNGEKNEKIFIVAKVEFPENIMLLLSGEYSLESISPETLQNSLKNNGIRIDPIHREFIKTFFSFNEQTIDI